MKKTKQKLYGFTLLETLMSIFVISILVVGALSLFNYTLRIISGNKAQIGAITIAEEKMEIIRNLGYDQVGTIGGIPAGNIPQNESVVLNKVKYNVNTQIIYIDDPYDGILGIDPEELYGNDYKKVRIAVSWIDQFGTKEIVVITNVAPKWLETDIGGGTLLITVFDANGLPVPQASVRIVNNQIIPAIDIASQTNDYGTLIFPGAPPAENSYQITVAKEIIETGQKYSSDYTCAVDADGMGCDESEGNPLPEKAHPTIFENQLTEISFAIDLLSAINVRTIAQAVPTEWQVNTDNTSYDQTSPAIAMCQDGNFIFAWRDNRQNNNPRIYGQKYNQLTATQWESDLAITTSNNQNYPDVAVDADCNIYVVWQDDKNGNQDVYFDKFDSAGNELWGNPIMVKVLKQSADQTQPKILINASSTAEYISFQDDRDKNKNTVDIYMLKYDPDHNQLWPSELKVNSDESGHYHYAQSMDISPEEIIYIVWHDNRDTIYNIYGQKIDKDGNKLWANDIKFTTFNTSTNSINADIEYSSDDYLYIVWQDARFGNYDIFAQKFNTDGERQWASDVKINSDEGNALHEEPVIVEDWAGDFYIVWSDNRNGDPDIYMQKIDKDGNKLIEFDVRINSNQQGIQEEPAILINSSGYLVITWHDNSSGNFDIKATQYSEDPVMIFNVGNVLLNFTGEKKIGKSPVIYKYSEDFSTDSSGYLTLTDMEWDTYTITALGGYTIASSEPAIPILINPNTVTSLIINVQ